MGLSACSAGKFTLTGGARLRGRRRRRRRRYVRLAEGEKPEPERSGAERQPAGCLRGRRQQSGDG